MYKKGDYIVYGSDGPCLVYDVTKLNIPGCDRHRKYYVLHPVISDKSVIYCPVDNQKVRIRDILSSDEAKEVLSGISTLPEMKIDNEKFREERYREVLCNTDFSDWIRMIKMLVIRRQRRVDEGRKFTSIDEKYLRELGEIVTCELSLALGEDHDTTEEMLRSLVS